MGGGGGGGRGRVCMEGERDGSIMEGEGGVLIITT